MQLYKHTYSNTTRTMRHEEAKTKDCIHTDLYDKSHCVEVVHPPVLEESKNIVNGST